MAAHDQHRSFVEGNACLTIDITSDNICRECRGVSARETHSFTSAWCYVGKRRLDKALAKVDRSKVDVRVRWHPFELDSSLPRNGSLLKLDRYKQKFGEKRVKEMLPAMIRTGEEEGIRFSYGGHIGSTFDSHRLLFYVREQGNDGEKKQNQLIDLLFRASFEQDEDLSDHRVLVRAAEQLAFDGQQIEAFLRSDRFTDEVRREIDQSHERGINGVPHFLLNDRLELSGARSPEEFLHAFQSLGVYG